MMKLNKDGTFEIKFIEAKEINGVVKVLVETPFGKDKITVRKNDYIDITGIPKWKKEVIRLINKKYEQNYKNNKNPINDMLKGDKETIFESNGKN